MFYVGIFSLFYLIRLKGDPEMGVSKNRGKTPRMDGENNGKPNPIKTNG